MLRRTPKLPTSIIRTPSTRYENFCKQQTNSLYLKGLSRETDLAFDDMYGLILSLNDAETAHQHHQHPLHQVRELLQQQTKQAVFKGTVSWDGFGVWWHVWLDLRLNDAKTAHQHHQHPLHQVRELLYTANKQSVSKGTVSRDGFGFWWHVWLNLSLNDTEAVNQHHQHTLHQVRELLQTENKTGCI